MIYDLWFIHISGIHCEKVVAGIFTFSSLFEIKMKIFLLFKYPWNNEINNVIQFYSTYLIAGR